MIEYNAEVKVLFFLESSQNGLPMLDLNLNIFPHIISYGFHQLNS